MHVIPVYNPTLPLLLLRQLLTMTTKKLHEYAGHAHVYGINSK